ncbi:hypothetical protein ASF72_01595 [Arthrobacter sp. Leaf141]|jgi:predicted DNA-binding protein|uniref:ribbon-helix-helix domain-containing protein n=1 Tax=Arthrobacter sp. Leaf141 TaxID=1736273 RepID=UPI0006F8BAEF|nr:ribbon-helix-helix domain-containing protein [Arthrobacter sp. Leaf141]KQQ96380.1 hypothetical protein ASF72_01595 [Arthrobacter sp. Leaf141]
MPQPFKGDRRNITVRLPVADAEKLKAFTDMTGRSKNDLVAALVGNYLKTIDLSHTDGQEALPIALAS